MSSGRLKIFASLAKYLEERRLYRCHLRTRPKPHVIPTRVYSGGDGGWMV